MERRTFDASNNKKATVEDSNDFQLNGNVYGDGSS
jgi:hypothetical protein